MRAVDESEREIEEREREREREHRERERERERICEKHLRENHKAKQSKTVCVQSGSLDMYSPPHLLHRHNEDQ